MVNAASLAASLGLSWTIAFAGQVVLRRALSLDDFGVVSTIEATSLIVVSMLSLGVDTFVRKEVSNRPGLALEFARPLATARWAAAVALAAILGVAFWAASGELERGVLAAVFCLAQAAVILGQTSAAYLHAVHRVGGVSVSSIVTKALWFAALGAALLGPSPIFAAPIALLLSELFRNRWLGTLFHREIGRPQRAPLAAVGPVLRGSMPYYVDSVNLALTSYAIPALLGLLTSTDESGLFSTARQLMQVPMFYLPVLAWVLGPAFAQLRQHSSTLLWTRTQAVLESYVVVAVAGACLLAPVIPTALRLVFGAKWVDATDATVAMAPGLAFTFVAVLLATALIADDRGWTVTKVNLWTMLGLVLSVVVPLASANFTTPGQAATIGALLLTGWEGLTAVVLWRLARIGWPSARVLALLALSCTAGTIVVAREIGAAVPGGLWIASIAALAGAVVVSVPDIVRQAKLLLGR